MVCERCGQTFVVANDVWAWVWVDGHHDIAVWVPFHQWCLLLWRMPFGVGWEAPAQDGGA